MNWPMFGETRMNLTPDVQTGTDLLVDFGVGDIVEMDWDTMKGGQYRVISKVWEGKIAAGQRLALPRTGWRVRVEALPGAPPVDPKSGPHGWCASWMLPVKLSKDLHYPHDCPRCKGPAYIGGNNNVDCKKKCS